MKQKHSRGILVFAFLFPLVFSGCMANTVDITKPLFAVSTPVYKTSEEDSRCKIGGVYFDFYNKADCSVVFIETRMNVYDRKTGNPAFTGSTTIVTPGSVKIRSGEKKQLCVCLDDYITVVSKNGYIIDQFYVSRIFYEDGRIWKDEFGLYATGSNE